MSSCIQQLWSLKILYRYISSTYVAKVYDYSVNRHALLKVHTCSTRYTKELIALRAYNGHGAASVLRHNDEHKALLLEYIEPGTTLGQSQQPIELNAQIIAQLMLKLHSACIQQVQLPSIEDNLKSLFNHSTLDRHHIIKAQGIAKELLQIPPAPVLLHGDLHYHNILMNQEGWCAIDPHGLIGDPAYEVGAYIRNFIIKPTSDQQLQHIVK